MNKLHEQIDQTREAVEQMANDRNINPLVADIADFIVALRGAMLQDENSTEAQETRAHKQLERAVKQAYKASAELDKLHKMIVKATGGMNPAEYVRNNSAQ